VEALGDAVAGDLDAVGVLGLESAILERSVEEIDDGERQALARVGGLEEFVSSLNCMAVGVCGRNGRTIFKD
jgi:hypothetical protein